MKQPHVAKKRLGQNFLQDAGVVHQIIEAIDIDPAQDAIIEVGPGQGALTYPLLSRLPTIDVIELDQDLVYLWEKQPGVSLHHQDVLTFDFAQALEKAGSKRLSVVGNLPYNIATPLILQLMPLLHRLRACVFMVQLEVAKRLVAEPGTKAYGRLSIMTQYFADIDLLITVPKEAFDPAPKVTSAVVHLKAKSTPSPSVQDWEQFTALIKMAFEQRRKTLGNALKQRIPLSLWSSLDIDKSRRPETLTIAEWVSLSNALWASEQA